MEFSQYKKKLEEDADFREHIGKCPLCNGNVKDRKITIYQELIASLYRVYQWCLENEVHEFDIKKVRHLIGKVEYTRWGDLVRCSGGIVYRAVDPKSGKTRKGYYGINRERAGQFFRGERTIPMQTTLNQVTNERTEVRSAYVRDLPDVASMLDKDGQYDHKKTVEKPTSGSQLVHRSPYQE